MGLMIWLGVTGLFWAVVMVRHCASEKECRGYRDVEAEQHDIEDSAMAWVLMWVLSGWLPCGAWIIIS